MHGVYAIDFRECVTDDLLAALVWRMVAKALDDLGCGGESEAEPRLAAAVSATLDPRGRVRVAGEVEADKVIKRRTQEVDFDDRLT